MTSSTDVAAGIDQSGMRRVNTATVLRALVETREPTTMAQLVERTGLSRRTLELILAALAEDGWACEASAPAMASRAGRPKKFYSLVPTRALVVSARIDDRDIEVVVADLRGDRLVRREQHVDPGVAVEEILRRAVVAAQDAVATVTDDTARVRGVSVGIGGTISDDGVILTSPVLPAWVGVDVGRPFARAFAGTVVVDNDTNLSALAEYWSGAAVGVDTFVMLVPGARLSAGLIIGGAVHRGFEGGAGELVRIRGFDIDRWREHPLAAVSSPDPAERAAAQDLLRAAARGDAAARGLAREFFGGVAGLISVVGWMLAPPLVVLSGAYEGAEELVLALTEEELRTVGAPALSVRLAVHSTRGPIVGGIRRALDVAAEELFVDGRL